MGLSRLEEFKVNTKFGYKVFVKRNKRLYVGNFENKSYKINIWYNEKEFRVNNSNKFCDTIELNVDGSIRYKKGFHIFLTIEEAKKYSDFLGECVHIKNGKKNVVIRMVEFKNVVATGIQSLSHNLKVIVAEDMRILSIREMAKKGGI